MSIETNVKETIARAQKASTMPTAPASGKAVPGQPNLSGELNNFIQDIEDLIKEATSLTGEELVQVKARLHARVAEARESVEELGGEIAEQARKGVAATNEYVHHQPWQAIGAGAAVGLLVGYMLARRQ